MMVFSNDYVWFEINYMIIFYALLGGFLYWRLRYDPDLNIKYKKSSFLFGLAGVCISFFDNGLAAILTVALYWSITQFFDKLEGIKNGGKNDGTKESNIQ